MVYVVACFQDEMIYSTFDRTMLWSSHGQPHPTPKFVRTGSSGGIGSLVIIEWVDGVHQY